MTLSYKIIWGPYKNAPQQQQQQQQELTKFDNLRRGITEDFQRLTKFKRTLAKNYQKPH